MAIYGEIYSEGKKIDEGIWTGGKHYTPEYPDQSIYICDYADSHTVEKERMYVHTNGISFKEFDEEGRILYDSNEMKEYDYTVIADKVCQECGKVRPENDFSWVNDRYGIPYKKVCSCCYDKVYDEIKKWVFDPTYAGESLEPEY